jgi:hypothetical protein
MGALVLAVPYGMGSHNQEVVVHVRNGIRREMALHWDGNGAWEEVDTDFPMIRMILDTEEVPQVGAHQDGGDAICRQVRRYWQTVRVLDHMDDCEDFRRYRSYVLQVKQVVGQIP